MNDRAATLLADRRHRLAGLLGRPLPLPVAGPGDPLTESEARFLQEEGENLYWNELEWENLMEEERLDGGPLAELTFPGFLAYVRGLLLEEVMPDALAPAAPRPEAVEGLLRFLARRVVELEEVGGDGDGPDNGTTLALTGRLLDLVLALLHRVPREVLDPPAGEAAVH